MDGPDERDRRVGIAGVEPMSGFESRDGPECVDVPGGADHGDPAGDQAGDERPPDAASGADDEDPLSDG